MDLARYLYQIAICKIIFGISLDEDEYTKILNDIMLIGEW